MDKELNEKHKAFADYYLINNNAAEAYKQAYDADGVRNIKKSTCYSNANKLLKNPKVKEYMSARMKEIKTDRLLDAEKILAEITLLATNPSVKPSDRLRALELLGKHQMLFTDKLQMDATMDVEINIVGMDETEEE